MYFVFVDSQHKRRFVLNAHWHIVNRTPGAQSMIGVVETAQLVQHHLHLTPISATTSVMTNAVEHVAPVGLEKSDTKVSFGVCAHLQKAL